MLKKLDFTIKGLLVGIKKVKTKTKEVTRLYIAPSIIHLENWEQKGVEILEVINSSLEDEPPKLANELCIVVSVWTDESEIKKKLMVGQHYHFKNLQKPSVFNNIWAQANLKWNNIHLIE